MSAPFESVLQALKWYRLTARIGFRPPLSAARPRERVRGTRRNDLDRILGEPAVLWKRIDDIVRDLPENRRRVLLADDFREAGMENRNAFHRRRYAIRRELTPVFEKLGLVRSEEEERGNHERHRA